jgi:site-specific DNA-methyltransferase (adenine-specific)
MRAAVPPAPNELHAGDNLAVLRASVADASVDLVYLDPPFASERDFAISPGVRRAAAAVDAFADTWAWDDGARAAFADVVARGGEVGRAMEALRLLVGEGGRLAYLAYMAPRLVELHRALRPTGSLYLHCDPTASHYLKVLLDRVFGPEGFRNEVVWRYRRWPAKSRRFQRMHDVLLFYAKTRAHVFEPLYGYEGLAASTRKTFGTKRQRADFSSGHRKPGQTDEESPGPPLSDVWDVPIIAPVAKERVGWPTQKPEALLERVIRASSREGDVVLDPCCGSGTALVVAQRLGRRFVGVDVSSVAIHLAERRLAAAFPGAPPPRIVGPRAPLAEAELAAVARHAR